MSLSLLQASFKQSRSPVVTLDTLRAMLRDVGTRTDLENLARETRRCIQQAKRERNLAEKAKSLLLLGHILNRQDKKSRALTAYEESLDAWTKLGNQEGLALTKERMACVLMDLGRDGDALPHLQDVLALYREREDRRGEALIQANMARAYKMLGEVALSQELLHASLAYYETLQSKEPIAKILLSIANNCNVLEEPEAAVKFALRGLALMETLDDQMHTALALGVVGTAYMKQEQYHTALSYFKRSLAMAQETDVDHVIATSLCDLGDAYMKLGYLSEAKDILVQAAEIQRSDRKGNRAGYCESLSRLGVLYANPNYIEHDEKLALEYLERACAVGEDSDTICLLVPIYAALVEVHRTLGNYEAALEYSLRLREVERRLFNDESAQRIRSLQVRFDLEKVQKDAEIAHLRSVELAKALTEAERLRAIAEERAHTDALTGIFNRRYFDEFLVTEFERACRYNRPLTVVLLDIDHFKKINDMFGHMVGDAVLKHVASLLWSSCRANCTDIVARYGGEEFALLLPEASIGEARTVCERIRRTIEEEEWSQFAPDLAHVTISLGLAEHKGGGDLEAPARKVVDLVAQADANLYIAKRQGRNRVVDGR